MPVKFTRRFADGLKQYEFYEIEADTAVELVEAEALIEDHLRRNHVSEEQAVQNLQNAGLVQQNPGYRGPVQEQPQQNGGWQPSVPEDQGPATPQEYCNHGPKKWVPAGFSKTTQKRYNGFWACPAPRGQQCPRN